MVDYGSLTVFNFVHVTCDMGDKNAKCATITMALFGRNMLVVNFISWKNFSGKTL